MVSSESGLIVDFNPGEMNDDEVVDMKTTKSVKWVAKLGSQAYGNVTVAGGRVYVEPTTSLPETRARKEIAAWSCAWTKKRGIFSGSW